MLPGATGSTHDGQYYWDLVAYLTCYSPVMIRRHHVGRPPAFRVRQDIARGNTMTAGLGRPVDGHGTGSIASVTAGPLARQRAACHVQTYLHRSPDSHSRGT